LRNLLECVVNISEGRDQELLEGLRALCGPNLLDVHADEHHHRSVFTLAGGDELPEVVRALAREVLERVDLRTHQGVHPRLGAIDVVPWVSLRLGKAGVGEGEAEAALVERNRFARWAGDHLALPCFLYGPERSLPELRRQAWRSLRPDFGPPLPHPSAGCAAVGARGLLVAYNLWLDGASREETRQLACLTRGPAVRALALEPGGLQQLSFNLIDPLAVGPMEVYDLVVAQLDATHATISKAELVGLLPGQVLRSTPKARWGELGLSEATTIEARLDEAGL